MNRLTPQERRRVYLARLNAPATSALSAGADERGRRWLIMAAMVAALIGGSFLASQALEFHAPASLVEALLPRL